jgi:hypothetical protein
MQDNINKYITQSKISVQTLKKEIEDLRQSILMFIGERTDWETLNIRGREYDVNLNNISLIPPPPKRPTHIPPVVEQRVSDLYNEVNRYEVVAKQVEHCCGKLLEVIEVQKNMDRYIIQRLNEYRGAPPTSPRPMEFLAARWEDLCTKRAPITDKFFNLGYTSVDFYKLLKDARNLAEKTELACDRCLEVTAEFHRNLKDFAEMKFRIFKGELVVDEN